MINLTADIYVYGFWYIECEEANWLAALIRDDLDGWLFTYRFYYGELKDTTGWYQVRGYPADVPEEEAVDHLVTKLIPIMERQFVSKMEFVELKCMGNDPKVVRELGSRDWTSLEVQKVDKDTKLRRTAKQKRRPAPRARRKNRKK